MTIDELYAAVGRNKTKLVDQWMNRRTATQVSASPERLSRRHGGTSPRSKVLGSEVRRALYSKPHTRIDFPALIVLASPRRGFCRFEPDPGAHSTEPERVESVGPRPRQTRCGIRRRHKNVILWW